MRLIDLLNKNETLSKNVQAHEDLEILGITSDSRDVRPGFLFAALSGAKVDGKEYVSKAIENGAVCILGPVGTTARVAVIEDQNPRLRLAKIAALFYAVQPENVAAVTGTNGKTSVATFLRQIWEIMGLRAVNIGTIGLFGSGFAEFGKLTTPDPVKLHEIMKRVAAADIDYLAMEASSHGLEQYRLDGIRIKAAGFTNISRDHLDYHGTMEDYRQAKLRLFSEVVEDGGHVVVNADKCEATEIIKIAHARNLHVISYGLKGRDICVLERKVFSQGQQLSLRVNGTPYDIFLPLVGSFQTENSLCALGLAMALGADEKAAVQALEKLEGVSGRVQIVGHVNGADVYIDYAHTPDALENVLKALRPHTKNKLFVMFGCGGDRDAGKRPQMGRIAAQFADGIIITDDNPRTEDAAQIRQEILAEAKDAIEIADRHEAIQQGIKNLAKGDVIVLTGKGHEQGQDVGHEVIPFSDVIEAKATIWELGQ